MTKKQTYEEQLIAAIKKFKWMRWSHIDWDGVNFSRRTAYEHKLHELHTIKDTFDYNRSKGVNYLLQKWMKSDNATLQIAAMRIIADEDDRQKLNQQYVDHSNKDGTLRVTDPFAQIRKNHGINQEAEGGD